MYQDGQYGDDDGGQIELIQNPRRGGGRNNNGYLDADMSQASRKDISNHDLDIGYEDNQINAGNQQDGKKFV